MRGYTPTQSAFLAQQLIAAGAVPLGKANLDRLDTGLNSNLGHHTHFMNLLDRAAVAVPAGFQASGDAQGLPWGVTLAAPAFRDVPLLRLADLFHPKNSSYAGAESVGGGVGRPI